MSSAFNSSFLKKKTHTIIDMHCNKSDIGRKCLIDEILATLNYKFRASYAEAKYNIFTIICAPPTQPSCIKP